MILGGGKRKWVMQRGFVSGKLRIFHNKDYLQTFDFFTTARGAEALAACKEDAVNGDEQAITALLMLEQE